jgi:2-polyprenyl-3-methyl-5-hydroxy-6-metoxy-1,4-benzoquinol methylase
VLSSRIREQFDVDDSVVTALPDAVLTASSYDRFNAWRTSLDQRQLMAEYLLPRIVRQVEREWPPFMEMRGRPELTREELKAEVDALGPWHVPFRLEHDLVTMQGFGWRVSRDRILFRRELIIGTAAEVLGADLGSATVLDIGCNTGFFSLDIATRGAKHVDGIDLRATNIAQAQFLADYYGIENVTFATSDADDLGDERRWDVVLNLGVLYHVTNPLQFLRQTYDLCRQFAVIDTTCHRPPFSGYLLTGDIDVEKSTEGREEVELHPTYRGVIDSIRYAGFSDVIEIVGTADPPHPLYTSGNRRCFLAIK